MANEQLPVAILLATLVVSLVSAQKYYIVPNHSLCPTETTPTGSGSLPGTPTDHTPILDEDCLTLTQYAQSPATTIDSNITLIFDPGHHTLDSRLYIQNVTNLVLRVANTFPSSVAMVTCTNSSGFDFATISEARVCGLEFRGCLENSVRSVDQLRMEDCRFQDGHGMELRNVRSATFERSSFISLTAFKAPLDSTLRHSLLSGGAIVAFGSDINVTKCLFEGNSAIDGRYGLDLGIGGAIWTNSSITIHDSNFSSNKVGDLGGGGAIWSGSGSIDVYDSNFSSNIGGAIGTYYGNIRIHGCNFSANVYTSGGAIWTNSGSININHSDFSSNVAIDGGAIYTDSGSVSIYGSDFSSNTASVRGGAIETHSGNISIHNSDFSTNTAYHGGAIFTLRGSTNIHGSNFSSNTAHISGGAVFTNSGSTRIHGSDFNSNTAAQYDGGAIESSNGNVSIHDSNFSCNTAKLNGGAIRTDRVSIHGSILTRNTATNGGALHLGSSYSFSDNINEIKNSTLNYNEAEYRGGAVYVQSTLIPILIGLVQITKNSAQLGGGIYSDDSELNFEGRNIISENFGMIGGGIYSNRLSIVRLTGGQLEFIENSAEKGGGIYLKSDAKLHLIKSVPECSSVHYNPYCIQQLISSLRLYFTNNSAEYGGALYISDNTVHAQLADECFFQDLASHNVNYMDLIVQNTFFANNSATISGASIFGGLLDRCTVSPRAQVFNKYQNILINATSYLTQITNLRTNAILQSEISSKPVRVCLCTNNQQDCDSPSATYTFQRTSQLSRTFNVSVVAVDQVRNPVPSSVTALSSNPALTEEQEIWNTTSKCTQLNFTISFPRDFENLTLVLNHDEQELVNINLLFIPCTCPIGFIVNLMQFTCSCECDPCLSNYITDCSVRNSSIKRSNNVWINYINDSNHDLIGYQNETQCPYLTYPYCPFDYCHPSSSSVWINLDTPNGSDAQCAFNRSGKLCGSCKDGFSLSLGSSRCLSCSNNWLALFIVFAIAGVALVAFLLIFNLTVAVGTINGLIFYANILATNRATFFPFQSPNFFTIFIAWLNLDFGFVTCFFDGMDGYVKEWLQLAFPIYIIFLVTMVIIGCEYSTRIARLFTGTNPVATLATLILLSYSKSLRVIIAAFSSVTLEYPDGSQEIVWLIDANVHILKGKHIPLFLVALLILLVGIVYTSLVFSYQWLLRCPNRMVRILKNARFYPFMDVYLAPYNVKHRYWTGLLLMIRAFLYVMAAININGDPRNNVFAIFCTLICLHFIRFFLPGKIYKSRLLDGLNFTFMMNLICFSVGSLYIRETQESLAYISMCIAFITFLAILVYHTYAFVLRKKILSKLDSFILKMKLRITKQGPIDHEIILVPRPVVTYSVVDPVPTQQQLLENTEKATTAAIAEREREESIILQPDHEQTLHKNNSQTKQISDSINKLSSKTRIDKDEEHNILDVELEPTPSIFADTRLDPYIRESDELGMERETEINDFIDVAD